MEAAEEAVVAYVIQNDMSLTALELYEELKERGVCSAELRAYVDASVKKAGDLPEDDISTEAGILQPTPAPMDGRLREALAENAMLKKQLAAVHRDGFATTNITNCPGSYESPQVLTAELHQLSLQLKKLEDRESALLQVIAERLPTIITSVRTSRKECLVQVLLAIIQQHSDPKVRTSLLFHYVTLFKRPDGEQRGLIVDGFKQVAQILSRSDPRRIETEILASLSVLTQNRYPEHRVLAIEATSALYEYLRPALQRELLTDVFHEWERDASGLVRETVVKTIAGMADTTNVRLCCPFLVSGLTDGSQRVLKAAVQSTKHLAALAVVERCLVPCIVDPLAATLAVDSSPPTVERTNLRFSAFSCLLDAVKEELAQTVPASIGSRSAALSLLVTKAIQRQVKGQWPAIEWLVGPFVTRVLSAIVTTAKMDTSKGAQNAKRGRDAVAPRELDGVHPPVSVGGAKGPPVLGRTASQPLANNGNSSTCAPGQQQQHAQPQQQQPQLPQQMDSTAGPASGLLHLAVDVLSMSSSRFGASFDADVVTPLFTDVILSGPEVLEPHSTLPTDVRSASSPQWHLLPAFIRYCAAVKHLHKHPSPEPCTAEPPEELRNRGTSDANLVSENVEIGIPSSPLSLLLATAIQSSVDEERCKEMGKAVCEVCIEGEDRQAVQATVVDVLWDCLPMEDALVRVTAARLLAILLEGRCLHRELVAKRVLPAVLALSSDTCNTVRLSAMRCCACLATTAPSADVLQRLAAASRGTYNFSQNDLSSCHAWLSSVQHHIPRMPPAFISSAILPQLDKSVVAALEAACPGGLQGTIEPQMHCTGILNHLIPLICDCVKLLPPGISSCTPFTQADENSGVTLNALLQSLRGLSKAMNDPVLSPLLGSTLVHLEAFVDRDEKENKRDRLFAKFRDLLPTNEHPTLDSRDRVPVPKPTSGTPKHDHAPHHSPSADDMPDISCLYPVNTNLSVTPAAYQAKNRSLFSKVQQKLFGGVD